MNLRVFVDRKDCFDDSIFGVVTLIEPNGDACSLRARVTDAGTPLQQTLIDGEVDQMAYLEQRYGGQFPLAITVALTG
jgi:hypothetical protein